MFSVVSPEKATLPSWLTHLYLVVWSLYYLCSQLIIMFHLGHQHHRPMSISFTMAPDTIADPYEDTAGLQVLICLITTFRS